AAVALPPILPPHQGWAWLCAPLAAPDDSAQKHQIKLDLRSPGDNPFAAGLNNDARDLGLAISDSELRAGPLAIDPESGLLLDYAAGAPEPSEHMRLLGISGRARGTPGAHVPITLWWRAEQAPP